MSISYADYDFYQNTYHGDSFSSQTDAMKALNRASDAVRQAIRYRDERMAPTAFQTEHLKRATCLTADYFQETGNAGVIASGGVTGYSIGDVNMQLGGVSDKGSMGTYGVPQRAVDELIVTGYLFRGL